MKKVLIIPFSVNVIIFMLIHTLVYSKFSNIGNIPYYVIFLSLFLIFNLLSFFAVSKIQFKENFIKIFSILFLVIFIVWFSFMYFGELQIPFFDINFSFRHRMPFIVYFSSLFIVFSSFCVWLYKCKRNSRHAITSKS